MGILWNAALLDERRLKVNGLDNLNDIYPSGAFGKNQLWLDAYNGNVVTSGSGRNDNITLKVENHRSCTDVLTAALLLKDKEKIIKAFNGIIWPLSDMIAGADYSFPFQRSNYNESITETGSTIHSKSVYLAGAMKALMLLSESGRCPNQINLPRYKRKYYLACRALRNNSQYEDFYDDKDNMNQRFFVGNIMYWAGLWGQDNSLIDEAWRFYTDNYSRMWSGTLGTYADGVLEEKAGFDLSYQSVSCEQISIFLYHNEDSMVRDMLSRATTRWELGWMLNNNSGQSAGNNSTYNPSTNPADVGYYDPGPGGIYLYDSTQVPVVANWYYSPSTRTGLNYYTPGQEPKGDGIDQYGYRAALINMVLNRASLATLSANLYQSGPDFSHV